VPRGFIARDALNKIERNIYLFFSFQFTESTARGTKRFSVFVSAIGG
jgi:hypothetical protein